MTKTIRATKLTGRQRRLRYAVRKAMRVAAIAAVVAGLIAADHVGAFGRAPLPDDVKYHGKSFRVVHVVDGDTLDVNIDDRGRDHTRIRLWGVDTPETVKPGAPVERFGRQAGAFAKQAAFDKQVRLELDPCQTRDKYGRLLAYVILPDGTMLNRVLIEEGYGYADPRYEHRLRDEFMRRQRKAMRAGRGMWTGIRQRDLPYYYRDRLKLPRPRTP